MPAPLIRAALLPDLPAITAIYAREVRQGTATFEIDPPEVAEMTRRFEAITQAGLPYLIAEEEGRAVGYAYAAPYRPRPAYRFTAEDSIYLAPQAQGRGIGFALVEKLILACEMWGCRQLIAVIGDSANAASIALHAKAGFTMIGTHPNVGFKFGRWLDTVMMQRPIGDGAASVPEITPERACDR